MRTPPPHLLALALLTLAACAPTPAPTPESPASPGAVAPPEPAALILGEEPWTFETVPGRMVRTPHYALYTTLNRGRLADRTPAFLERALFHYTSEVTDLPKPSAPLETFLLATRPQWNTLTQKLLGEEAGPYLRIDRGGFSHRGKGVYYDLGPINDTLTIAAHEGWHQYVQTTFRQALPVWADEGLATYMEGFRPNADDPTVPDFMPWANLERYETLRLTAARSRLLPLDEFLRTTPQALLEKDEWAPLRYYAQAWGLIQFLREGEGGIYAAGLAGLLRDASLGRADRVVEDRLGRPAATAFRTRRDGTAAFTAYISPDLALLDAQYKAFVDQITARGVRAKIVQGKSPILNP
jgi:hypothetical protein